MEDRLEISNAQPDIFRIEGVNDEDEPPILDFGAARVRDPPVRVEYLPVREEFLQFYQMTRRMMVAGQVKPRGPIHADPPHFRFAMGGYRRQ